MCITHTHIYERMSDSLSRLVHTRQRERKTGLVRNIRLTKGEKSNNKAAHCTSFSLLFSSRQLCNINVCPYSFYFIYIINYITRHSAEINYFTLI